MEIPLTQQQSGKSGKIGWRAVDLFRPTSLDALTNSANGFRQLQFERNGRSFWINDRISKLGMRPFRFLPFRPKWQIEPRYFEVVRQSNRELF
jgi:hypothetical protein